jgi:diaminohydroxyphosphoribosylaminopyrimidine deaminase / 5-amino-6-(5-phosphoribosylamino)uracil reductase
VRQDNPHLTHHGQGSHNPLRVVMSRRLNLPTTAHLWDTAIAPTLVFTQSDADLSVQTALLQQGVEIVSVSTLTPAVVMKQLYERDVMSVLWECGGTLAAEAISDGAVQKVWAFIAPKLIGGSAAPSPIGELGLTQMTQAKSLSRVSLSTVGEDFLLQGYL